MISTLIVATNARETDSLHVSIPTQGLILDPVTTFVEAEHGFEHDISVERSIPLSGETVLLRIEPDKRLLLAADTTQPTPVAPWLQRLHKLG